MPNISSLNHAPRIVPSKHPNIPMRKSANYAGLQNELNRLRTVLAHQTMMSHLITTEPELFPDPIDQAASEYETDIALQPDSLYCVPCLTVIEQTSIRS